ncbi:hypothetical protein [Campylobacter corcagiensis]|uniref:TlpA family protein disulfide reductase n=1 Tax=Campylobacter corcagiensis TaxID=1448857 RepID=A0A7M1LH58_9BACT|nr:hypothetical protein [Campylobacter corcagiensis]QKF65011.1 protein disulfide reductase, TlpA family [Campylobacter corcagiensis]QOQ86835.1 TlpA family protein disulfide reductase [Campylobacter corcagiensis]
MKKVILAAFLTLFLVGCGNEEKQSADSVAGANKEYFKIGDEITLKSVTGSDATIIRTDKGFKLKGSDKILMIDIFATFCDPCKSEAPHLMDFQLNNSDDFFMIGLIHFEDVDNEHILNNFMKPYNAYYFIANGDVNPNDKLVSQILTDINYQRALTIPFKVVYNKDGVTELVTNNENISASPRKYYVGALKTKLLEDDISRMINATK